MDLFIGVKDGLDDISCKIQGKRSKARQLMSQIASSIALAGTCSTCLRAAGIKMSTSKFSVKLSRARVSRRSTNLIVELAAGMRPRPVVLNLGSLHTIILLTNRLREVIAENDKAKNPVSRIVIPCYSTKILIIFSKVKY